MRRTSCHLILFLVHTLCMMGVVESFTAQKLTLAPKPTLSKTTSLKAAPGFGAIAGAITGGLFAGGLHAIAGACSRNNEKTDGI